MEHRSIITPQWKAKAPVRAFVKNVAIMSNLMTTLFSNSLTVLTGDKLKTNVGIV